MHCNLRPCARAGRSGGVFGRICTAHAHELQFRASGQNSDNAIRFTVPDLLKENNNMAIRRRFELFFAVQIKNLPYFYFRSN